jgi:uncharacterized phage protein (TIGR02218 family)
VAFDDVEQSTQDGAPAELYTFVTPTITHRLTSFENDVVFGGQTYTAVPLARSTINVVDVATDQTEAVIELPASHTLAQTYANGIPVRQVEVTIVRYHPVWAVSLQIWNGFASGLSFKDDTAAFRVPSGTADALETDVPSVIAQRLCNHILYDDMCQIARASFQVNTTINSISTDGRTITVNSVGAFTVDKLVHGEMLHNTSTERRTITVQNGSSLSIQCEYPRGVVSIGDAVTLFAGCDHTLDTCKAKFNNVLNFGGHPQLPKSNIFYIGVLTYTPSN